MLCMPVKKVLSGDRSNRGVFRHTGVRTLPAVTKFVRLAARDLADIIVTPGNIGFQAFFC